MLVALLGAVLTAGPDLAVVVTRREGMSTAEAELLAERVKVMLAEAGLKEMLPAAEQQRRLDEVNVSDTASCEGRRDCAIDVGALMKVPVLVAIELGALRRVWAVHLEVFSIADRQSVTAIDQTLSRRDPLAKLEGLAGLVKQASAAARAAPPPAPAGAPLAGGLPAPELRLSAVTTRALYGLKRKNVGLVTSALAVAAGGVAIGFLVLGKNQEGALAPQRQSDGSLLFALPMERAQAQVDAANLSYTVALTCGIIAGALAAVSAWLFATDDLPAGD